MPPLRPPPAFCKRSVVTAELPCAAGAAAACRGWRKRDRGRASRDWVRLGAASWTDPCQGRVDSNRAEQEEGSTGDHPPPRRPAAERGSSAHSRLRTATVAGPLPPPPARPPPPATPAIAASSAMLSRKALTTASWGPRRLGMTWPRLWKTTMGLANWRTCAGGQNGGGGAEKGVNRGPRGAGRSGAVTCEPTGMAERAQAGCAGRRRTAAPG
jgi:hypothetical protein